MSASLCRLSKIIRWVGANGKNSTAAYLIFFSQISHCILDVNITAVERLHRNQVYPIVLLLRFKSAKQIKEIKDSRYSTDKLSAKQAKEMYEHAMKLESEYKQYVSGKLSEIDLIEKIHT